MSLKEEALEYHCRGERGGKISSIPTKPGRTQKDLTLAYSPGVAYPCKEIEREPELAYKYTNKGNLIAVISNGTAVLGLGDIGAQAGKPVMEGKSLLFKVFSGIDSFDLEVKTKDIDEFCTVVKNLEPSFGGINLEDIKAPECFEIEERLKKEMNIPVMHDDQHGTAMIVAAGFMNACEIIGKKPGDVKIVVNGAGASAISCMKLLVKVGASKHNIIACDSKGVINSSRTDLNKYKKEFVSDTKFTTLAEAINGADVFLGLSTKDILTDEMLKSMAKDPIIFAMANPDPEVPYEKAKQVRPDAIVGTGRSDNPNQVNNVLGFPFIFRGALDTRATGINDEMKVAVSKALAALAKEEVPQEVLKAYNLTELKFGKDYIIPKPVDPRLLYKIAPAVAKAAIETGVARKKIEDWKEYDKYLKTIKERDEKLLP